MESLLRRRYMAAKAPADVRCLTFGVMGSASYTVYLENHRNNAPNVEYSYDKKTWRPFPTTYATSVTFSNNAPLYVRGMNPNGFSHNSADYSNFNVSGTVGKFLCTGNIMHLIDYTQDLMNIPKGASDIGYTFYRLFYNCSALYQAPELPATGLQTACYNAMFSGCGYMYIGPSELPATVLTNNCYQQMFTNCTSLAQVPEELPATTATQRCYDQMFYGCSNIMRPPKIMLQTAANYCCSYMFYNCRFTRAPYMSIASVAEYCCQYMFASNTVLQSLENLALPAMTLQRYCYQSMFYGCRALQSAPVLPAINLNYYCYDQMFRNCSSLRNIKAMFVTTPSASYTGYWVDGVAASGIFIKNSNATWPDTFDVNSIPTGWTVQTELP